MRYFGPKQRVTKKHLANVAASRKDKFYRLADRGCRNGRGSSWLKENRLRRSCGVAQKRVLPFGLGIFDPMDRTVHQTLSDGVVEVKRV